MRFVTITCSTEAPHTCTTQIFSGDSPFKDISWWLSLRSNVKPANRPAKPRPQIAIDRGLDDKLWSLIEDCWSQEPSDRPTAEMSSLRLRDVNGFPVNTGFVQSHSTLKQQDRNISVNDEHFTAGRAGGVVTRNQPNVDSPLARHQILRNYTEIKTAPNDDITRCVPNQRRKLTMLTFY